MDRATLLNKMFAQMDNPTKERHDEIMANLDEQKKARFARLEEAKARFDQEFKAANSRLFYDSTDTYLDAKCGNFC